MLQLDLHPGGTLFTLWCSQYERRSYGSRSPGAAAMSSLRDSDVTISARRRGGIPPGGGPNEHLPTHDGRYREADRPGTSADDKLPTPSAVAARAWERSSALGDGQRGRRHPGHFDRPGSTIADRWDQPPP